MTIPDAGLYENEHYIWILNKNIFKTLFQHFSHICELNAIIYLGILLSGQLSTMLLLTSTALIFL